MGKLTDLIKRVSRTEPEPMGFGATARKARSSMVLVAIVGEHWPRGAGEAVDAGADAVLLTGRPGENDVKETVSATQDKPCGLIAGDASAEQLDHLREIGADFAVLSPNAPAASTVDQKLSLIFHMRDDLTDIQLRTIEGLPIEAIYLDREIAPLTIMRIVELQRVAGLSRKPLLVQVAPDIAKQDLVALRDAGVALAGIDMKERDATDALRTLREVMDAMPHRRERKDEQTRVALTHARGDSAEEEGEDDE
jgi:hypothetical protein